MTGRCRFCGCTDDHACGDGCSWFDHAHTLCSACLEVQEGWVRWSATEPPTMRRAFFRGWCAGADDDRVLYGDRGRTPKTNPYPSGRRRDYWRLGFEAGQEVG